MDKIKFSAFDVFRYALPGLVILTSMLLALNPSIKNPADFIVLIKSMNLSLFIVIILVGYVIGFSIDPIGIRLRVFIARRIWKDRREYKLGITLTEQLILIRKFEENLYRYIETWYLLSGMAANLAFGVLLLLGSTLFKGIQTNQISWFVLAAVSGILFYLLLSRAQMFEKWARRELSSAIYSFNLSDKLENRIMNNKAISTKKEGQEAE